MENSTEKNSQPKLKVFQALQVNLTILGIEPELAKQSFNARILISLSALGLGIIGTLIYIFIEAETFFEFMLSLYMCSACVDLILMLLILILNSSEMYKHTNDFECFFNTSKCENLD